MNIKSEKGFTGADITVAILIVTIFAGIIAAMYQNYTRTSKEIERNAEATNYAVDVIEEIKANSQEYFTEANAKKNLITVYESQPINNSGYTKTVELEDYASLGVNPEAKVGYVKKVNVTIEYKLGNERKSVELSTIISKEN